MKEGEKMKRFMKTCVACLAMMLVQGSVNSACSAFIYQNKLPEAAKKYRKF